MLPAKWQASALLQDFVYNRLHFGRFVYDEAAAAFRFRIADRFGTSIDYLVTEDRQLFALDGGDMPTSCRFVGNNSPFTVPDRDWLDSEAVCVGRAPILAQSQDWWKTPSGEGANWIWYNSDSRLPFRSMYYEDEPITDPEPIYEHFTFNYFPEFEAVESTNLARVLEMCLASPTPESMQAPAVADAESLLGEHSYPETNADTIALGQGWIPGLSECSSTGDLPPPWPSKIEATVMMTAVSFPPNPFPSRVYYDWTNKPPAQNTSLYYYKPDDPEDYVQIALLSGNTGYIRIEDEQGHRSMCEQALPGPQIPNWQVVDGCQCRAQIAPGSVLNPTPQPDGVPTKILWCPTDLSANQVFWTWYSDSGTPVVFMQTNSSPTDGTGLNLADYYGWRPGASAPAGTFDVPTGCGGEVAVPQACHNCHLPLNS